MNWVEAVTKDMNPDVAPLLVALDPDRLLSEEAVQAAIRARGYVVLEIDDEVAFRFTFETKVRGHAGQPVLVIQAGERREDVPFDLLTSAAVTTLSLSSLFPNLSAPVVRAIDRADLPVVFDAQQRECPSPMNDSETKKFILLHAYGLVAEVMRTPTDLLRELLRLHYGARTLPGVLAAWLVNRLRASTALAGWPVADILTDRQRFLSFLQERWPAFLYRSANLPIPEDVVAPLPEVPFGHHDIRVYVDTLFIEGALVPVSFAPADAIADDWVRIGISGDSEISGQERLGRLLDILSGEVPAVDCRYRSWMTFAQRWAEVSVLWHALDAAGQAELEIRHSALCDAIDDSFSAWLARRYSGLHSQPPAPPVMLHHVPRAMARLLEDGQARKVALVVVDGLALDQWLILRPSLTAPENGLAVHDDAAFAWVPTLTSVSRQALFSGRPPVQIGKHLGTMSKEPSLWARFWTDQGYTGVQIGYRKGLGDSVDLHKVEEDISRPQMRVIGLIVDKIDRIMHGMELGMNGMHSQIALWAKTGYLSRLAGMLVNAGFDVFLTSDHGNIEGRGIGRPAEGANAEERGERVRTYTTDVLRQQTKAAFPTALEWPAIGLPADYLPLLAAHRDAFIAEGKTVVGHGGASLEEVIVPLVRIGKG